MLQIITINGKKCIPLHISILILSEFIKVEKGIQILPQVDLNNNKEVEMFEKMFNIACHRLNIDFYE